MIETILLFTLRPGVTDEQVEALRAALAAIPFEGRHNMRLGRGQPRRPAQPRLGSLQAGRHTVAGPGECSV